MKKRKEVNRWNSPQLILFGICFLAGLYTLSAQPTPFYQAPAPNTSKLPAKYSTNTVKPDVDMSVLSQRKILLTRVVIESAQKATGTFFYNKDNLLVRAEYWSSFSVGAPDTAADHFFYDDQKRIALIVSEHFEVNKTGNKNLGFTYFFYEGKSGLTKTEYYAVPHQYISDAIYKTEGGNFVKTTRNAGGNYTDTVKVTTDGKRNMLFMKDVTGWTQNRSFYPLADPTSFLPEYYNMLYTRSWVMDHFEILFQGNENLVREYTSVFGNVAKQYIVEDYTLNSHGLVSQVTIKSKDSGYPTRITFQYLVK